MNYRYIGCDASWRGDRRSEVSMKTEAPLTAGEAAKFGNERALEIGIEIGQLVAENRGIGREAARAALIEAAKGGGCTDVEIENLVGWGMRAIEAAANGVTQDGQPQGRNA